MNVETEVFDFARDFSKREKYIEVIRSGAFVDSLNANDEVVANIDHNNELAFALRSKGELVLQEDPKGLFASVWLPETDIGERVLREYHAGNITGASFRAIPKDGIWASDNSSVERTKLKLEDVCVCIGGDPAYAETADEVIVRSKKNNDVLFLRLRYQKLKSVLLNKLSK